MKLNDELKKSYEWGLVEKKIYNIWERSGYFNPDNLPENLLTKDDKGLNIPYTIILPPPNVTGTLHCGHALMLAIQDSLIRYKRMNGYMTLWLPGTDHAAISTQSVVEKKIYKEENKSRHQVGREEMVERINKFAIDSQNTILSQFRDMGASLDWSRLAFTLDEARNKAVNHMFKKMYDDGLIYRGHRIVNWDPKGQTTISDDEVVYNEVKTKFYYLKFGPFVIGTSRPETKFGDKYVVMHPDDSRYKEYTHGQKINVEWINDTIEATIIKDSSVDPEFGTGVMTITPWHSVVDFEIAQRYNLTYEQIIDKYGKLLPICGADFEGIKIKDAREKIIHKLQSKGLLVDKNGKRIETTEVEDYTHNIATAERTGGTIEPQIMNQWFVAVNKEFKHFNKKTTLKKLMIDFVESGKIQILPDRFSKIYFHWIHNLRDWCISRQIWYGHRIPVWYDKSGTIISVGENTDTENDLTQDEDTLDTWFSSGMWTFSTLGWPDNTLDFGRFHPTDVLETGYDIIFFWVARMIMMSTYALNQEPFKNVYLHGLVLDGKGKKMSKSVGNVLDPRDMISKYGTDALRISMLVSNGPGNDLRLDENKVKAHKLFANKLWNATRFVLEKCEDFDIKELNHYLNNNYDALPEDKKRDINKLLDLKLSISKDIDNYRLHIATEKLYDFFWKDFCDITIEKYKIDINENRDKKNTQATLLILLREHVKMLHPFMPFITEEIWEELKLPNESLLMVTKW